MDARALSKKVFRYLVGSMISVVSYNCFAYANDRLSEALALLEAEIQVRDYHLLHTPNIDKKLTLKKIQELETQKKRLSQQLTFQQQQQAAETFKSEKERLREVFSFSNRMDYTCQLEQALDTCLSAAIQKILNKVIIAFSENGNDELALPTIFPESGHIVLSANQDITYKSDYDVTFSEQGLVTYILMVEGELAIAASDEELVQLENSIFQTIRKESQAEIQQLVSQYKISLMKEDSLIDKKEKKKRLFGSF